MVRPPSQTPDTLAPRETRVIVDPSADRESTLLNVGTENPVLLYVTISPVLIPTENLFPGAVTIPAEPIVKFVPDGAKENLFVSVKSALKVLIPTVW